MPAWSAQDEFILRQLYADESNEALGELFGRAARAVGLKARGLGLQKSARYMKTAGRIQPGQEPWNKGKPGSTGKHPNCRRTQFRKGRPAREARNYVPVGTVKFDRKRGVVVRKLTDDPAIYPAGRWRPVHVIVWEAANGPVPEGHIVRFRDGMKTLDPDAIAVEQLELVTLAENMRRNSYHTRYPKEVARLIQLKGALTRKVNRRSRNNEESNERRARPPVRHARGTGRR